MAIQPHLEVLGQDEVFLRVLLIPVPLGDLKHIAPLGGAVFYTTAAVLPAGGHRQRHDPIPHGKEQQAPGGIHRPVDGKRIVHGRGEFPQQIHEVHPGAPASGHQKGCPPNDGQRQQPHPPWIFPYSYRIKNNPPFRRKQKSPRSPWGEPTGFGGSEWTYLTGVCRYLLFNSLRRMRSNPTLLRPADR